MPGQREGALDRRRRKDIQAGWGGGRILSEARTKRKDTGFMGEACVRMEASLSSVENEDLVRGGRLAGKPGWKQALAEAGGARD